MKRGICSYFLVGAVLLATIGCQSPEKTARDVIAAASGAIVAAQAQYQSECSSSPTGANCVLINKAVDGQNVAVTALETYCQFALTPVPPDPSTKCSPVKAALPALQTALQNLNQLTGEVKGVLKK